MLGKLITDEVGAEEGGTIQGMGLLPIDTIFQEEKIRTRVKGNFGQISGCLAELTGEELEGYEIHMGISTANEKVTALTSICNELNGEVKADGVSYHNIYGSYVHGIFDNRQTADKIIECLAKEKNIDFEHGTSMDYKQYKEAQYDKLAETLRIHLDMDKIYQILWEGVDFLG